MLRMKLHKRLSVSIINCVDFFRIKYFGFVNIDISCTIFGHSRVTQFLFIQYIYIILYTIVANDLSTYAKFYVGRYMENND